MRWQIMKQEEALSIKQLIEEALKRYSDITKEHASITVSIREEALKKLMIFKTKNYSISISPESNIFELSSQVNSFEDAQKVIDQINQQLVKKLSMSTIKVALGSSLRDVNLYGVDKEYQQIQNQNTANTSQPIVGNNISCQKFFPIMFSHLKEDTNTILNGDAHSEDKDKFYPALFLSPESSSAFEQICKWKFDLNAIGQVEEYVKEVEKQSAKDLSENNRIAELIERYLKTRENLLPQKDIEKIFKIRFNVLSECKETIDQAKEILKEIKDENKTDSFKAGVEPYVIACDQAIEITRTRLTTIMNMMRNTSEYVTSQEYKDFLSSVILEKGNDHQKKYFQVCEQIAGNGGLFRCINQPSQVFKPSDTYLSSIEEARLYHGKVVSVYDQTVAGENFYPVVTPQEKKSRDLSYNKYDRGYDENGKKREVSEAYKRQAVWYSGSDGSTYLWLKGVGFINTETETLLTAEEFKNLEARGVKIVIAKGLDYLKNEISHPRMKDGSPYMSVYDFERSMSVMSFFRGEEVPPKKEVLYKILKENGLIPHYFGKQAIQYLDSRFGYYTSKEQEKEDSAKEFNEFDFQQEVDDSIFETARGKVLKGEDLDKTSIEDVKEKVKASLAEKIRKAGLIGEDSISVKDEDLNIVSEIVTITKIIAKEQGIDIEVEAAEDVGENVTAVANYNRNKITFNLKALRNLDGFNIDVTKLEKGDVINSSMKIIRLIQTMLHEIKHFEQKARIDNIGNKCDLETFKEAVENEIIKTSAGHRYYQKAHDNFLSEINADIFGWEDCIKCFKEYFSDRVPPELISRCKEELANLSERKQPNTNTAVQGNGCLSSYLIEYGSKQYSTGKLVAEQFLEIIQNLEKKVENSCDHSTRSLIEAMINKCNNIKISSHSAGC